MRAKLWDCIFSQLFAVATIFASALTTPGLSNDTAPLSTSSNFLNQTEPQTTKQTTLPVTSEQTTEGSSSTVLARSTFPFDFSLSRKNWTKSEDMSTNHKSIQSHTYQNKHHHEHHWGPFFEEPLNTSEGALPLAAHLSTEAVLNCRVGMLKDKTVMWVRRTADKVSLLTVGNITYSGDPRIRVKFQYPNNWRLIINPIQREDASLYMCQVSTHPPRVFATNLTVLEPPIRVIDEQGHEVRDRYYKAGSTIDLTCQASRHFLRTQKKNFLKQNLIQETDLNSHNSSTSEYSEELLTQLVRWKKDGGVLPAAAISNTSWTVEWHNNRISISHANFSDEGIYSCSIANMYDAVVHVQVLTGELPAAVQHNSKGPTKFSESSFVVVLLTILHFFVYISPSL